MSLGFSNNSIQYFIQQLTSVKPRFLKKKLPQNESPRKFIGAFDEIFETMDKDHLSKLFLGSFFITFFTYF